LKTIDQAFAAIFKVDAPYGRFQTEPAEHLLDGRNVILQAPTGSGKTKAALFPYLLARKEGMDFPRKLIYCVPMRVLARSFWDELRGDEQHKDIDLRLQTGEQQDDRRLEGEITFATIDQILSSFLNIPYSLSMRQGNMNAGAVVSSYLVFDEFHLLDPSSTLPTTLEMLRMLKGITPFLLMTATFSKEMLNRLASLLDAEVVTVSDDELKSIPTQKNKDRRFYRIDTPLTAEEVLQHHHTRSIAICNTVERAQKLFEELSAQADPGTEIILLHSRYLKEDRRRKEDEIRNLFGKTKEKGGSVILVATQVIEVGLDITCEVMHTEVAPASSILQRAGRCARFKDEKGEVYVYQVPADENGKQNYAPYLDEQAALSRKTWDVLPSFAGINMDFAAEQCLIDLVHAEADGRMLDSLEQTRYVHRNQMENAIDSQDLGCARQLIRNIDSVTVLLHPNPIEIEEPYELEGFSIYRGTLHGKLREWQDAGLPNEDIPWTLMYPWEKDDEYTSLYEWLQVGASQDLNRSPIYVIHPLLAQYDSKLGFRFARGGSFQSPIQRQQNKGTAKERCVGHERESYEEHIRKMLNVYNDKLSGEMAYAAARLEKLMGLSAGSLQWAVLLAIALHDVGKMNRNWQRWAHEWQRLIGAVVGEEYMLAHTDYNPADPLHRSVESETSGRRPPHAAEGAVAVLKILYHLVGAPEQPNDPRYKLMKSIFTAIVKHHSPSANHYRSFDLHPASMQTLARVLRELNASQAIQWLEMRRDSQRIDNLVKPSDRHELMAYFLIVRALRLSDQEAVTRKV